MELQLHRDALDYAEPIQIDLLQDGKVSVRCNETITGFMGARVLQAHQVVCDIPFFVRVDQGRCLGSPPEGGWVQLQPMQSHAGEPSDCFCFSYDVPQYWCTPREDSWKFTFEIQQQPDDVFVLLRVDVHKTRRQLPNPPIFAPRQALLGAALGALLTPVVLFFSSGRNPTALHAGNRYHPLAVLLAASVGFLIGGSENPQESVEVVLNVPEDGAARSMRERWNDQLEWSRMMSAQSSAALREQLSRNRFQ
mmetsp:Transcript_37072/g.69088  ORF Transcript_37072/g.69088 Transcript_37072/m.69088 type:complete len:251 (+) Transcript_37072:72-824(+)